MPLYTRIDQVKQRLQGKVKFSEDVEELNKLSNHLLRRLMDEAEADVEFDLAPRYAAPFKNKVGESFDHLPDRPTKEIIRTLCELKSVVRVLETDFGRGSSVNGDAYCERVEKRYQNILDRITARRDDMTNQWKYPPLPDLMLNDHNTEADDGFFGMILSTSDNIGDYPKKQINDPSKTFQNVKESDVID